ncbi:MAG: diphosphomevalonate decarboxylase [Planctomycetota bacterium]
MSRATAIAGSNIALVKYWGKRSGTRPGLNLPAVGSLSVTLDSLTTRTTVALDESLEWDEVTLSDPAGPRRDAVSDAKVSGFLDRMRQRAGEERRARVETHNDFPTAAGLASSASGFAALAKAASAAMGWSASDRELSLLARQGSGSAARSIFGGFVEWHRGVQDDGSDSFAEPIAETSHWPLRVVVAVTRRGPKATGSREGMEHSRETSAFWQSWLDTHPADLESARAAIEQRDFERLAEVTEASCLKMHAVMMSSRPGLLYWRGATLEVVHAVREMRMSGVPVCFTIDAGPQVKVVCEPDAEARAAAMLESLPGVEQVIASGLGPGARLVNE